MGDVIDLRPDAISAIAIGIGAEAAPGELVFGLDGRRLIRMFADGKIEVNGRAVESDLELVNGLRSWLLATTGRGCGRCGQPR